MDARLVQEIVSSLHDGSKHSSLNVMTNQPTIFPLLKIVWGGWDNICGPAIQYSWEIEPEQRLDGGCVCSRDDRNGMTTFAVIHAADEPGPSTRPDAVVVDNRAERLSGSDTVLSRALLQALSSELCCLPSTAKLSLKTLKFKLFAADKLTAFSFVFSAKLKQAETLQVLCFLLPSASCDFMLQTVPLLKSLVYDVVLKIRGWAFVESLDTTVYNLTQCWGSLTSILDAVFNRRLQPPEMMLANSRYARPNLCTKSGQNKFVSEAIDGALQSMGHVIVIGSEANALNNMISTLALLLPAEERCLCCVCPSDGVDVVSCPYLKTRGLVLPTESPLRAQLLHGGSLLKLAFPTALIDMDRQTVRLPLRPGTAGQWAVSAARASEAEVRSAMGLPPNGPAEQIEWKTLNGSKSDIVEDILTQLDLLPYDSDVRSGYFTYLQRYLRRWSEFLRCAFLDKRQRHPELSTAAVRKQARQVAKLSKDSDFAIVLAEMERRHPGLSRAFYD